MDIPVESNALESRIFHAFSPEPNLEGQIRAGKILDSLPVNLENEDVKKAQILGIAAAVEALQSNKNFLLADGMGMGKTVQAVAIAKDLIQIGRFKDCVIVTAPGGTTGWDDLLGDTPHEVWTRAKADKNARYLQASTLLIIDEIHGFKGETSSKGGVLSTYRRPNHLGAVTCPILGMSGTLTDTDTDLKNYATYLELDAELSPAKLLKSAFTSGQLAMRSLEYPNFGIGFSEFEVDISELGIRYRKEYDGDSSNLFAYSALIEREYLQHHLHKDITLAVEGGQTPIVLTSQSNKREKNATKSIVEQIEEVILATGCSPIVLRSRPKAGELDQLIIALKQQGKTPAIIGTMQSLGTGANLQDTVGASPRNLIVTGITMEVTQMIQTCYRVLRPNSESIPTITFPISNHPIHKFAMGCVAAKLNSHPNADATFKRLQAEMAQVTPLALTYESSALKLLQLDRDIFKEPSLAVCLAKAAHAFPSVKGTRYKVDPDKIPGFYDFYLQAQKDDRLKNTLNVSPDGSVFAIQGDLTTSWMIFLEQVLYGERPSYS